MTQQTNFRLPELTQHQLESLSKQTGLTKTQLVILAINALAEKHGIMPETK